MGVSRRGVISRRWVASGPSFARPDGSTVVSGTWSITGAATRHEAVDDVSPDDATTMVTNGDLAATMEYTLSDVTDPGVGTGHSVRVRCIGSSGSHTLGYELRQGTTVIASRAAAAPGTAWTNFDLALSTVEADSITDYTDLRVRVTAGNTLSNGSITQIYLKVP